MSAVAVKKLAPGAEQSSQEKILHFPRGLVGFKGPMSFILTALPDAGDLLTLLQSTDNPELAFTLVAPHLFFSNYQPRASAQDLEEVGLEKESDAIWMCIATIPQDFRQATVNLRAPLLINAFRRMAKQVVLVEDYPVRQPLFKA